MKRFCWSAFVPIVSAGTREARRNITAAACSLSSLLHRAKTPAALKPKKCRRGVCMASNEAAPIQMENVPRCHFLVLDKPEGQSSALVVDHAKKVLGDVFCSSLKKRYIEFQSQKGISKARAGKSLKKIKIGHGGTLDPFATGVLVLGIEGGTKLLDTFLAGTKAYECTALFGSATDTQDKTGKVIEQRDFAKVTEASLNEIIQAQFLGDIMQVPPMYSALKVDGKRLYEYARDGQTVHVESRPIHVHAFEVIDVQIPAVRFRIECGGGTYVRTLVHDLAHALDSCAHLTQLKRTRCGAFKIKDAIPGDKEYLESLGGELVNHLIPAASLKAEQSLVDSDAIE